jgi:hypothetical protein
MLTVAIEEECTLGAGIGEVAGDILLVDVWSIWSEG